MTSTFQSAGIMISMSCIYGVLYSFFHKNCH